MDVLIGGLIFVLWPIFTGFLFALIVGGSLFLAYKLFELFIFFVINPIIAKIRKIPFIGVILCFIITLMIGAPLLVFYILYVALPATCIVIHGLSYGMHI